jgi:hypothetical protein
LSQPPSSHGAARIGRTDPTLGRVECTPGDMLRFAILSGLQRGEFSTDPDYRPNAAEPRLPRTARTAAVAPGGCPGPTAACSRALVEEQIRRRRQDLLGAPPAKACAQRYNHATRRCSDAAGLSGATHVQFRELRERTCSRLTRCTLQSEMYHHCCCHRRKAAKCPPWLPPWCTTTARSRYDVPCACARSGEPAAVGRPHTASMCACVQSAPPSVRASPNATWPARHARPGDVRAFKPAVYPDGP